MKKNRIIDDKKNKIKPLNPEHKLISLRALMRKQNLHAYLIPSEDEHNCEYISPSDKRREFVSNFSGSNGFAIVTLTNALLWTDGRYFLQAEEQLDLKCWTLMKIGIQESREQYLKTNLKPGQKIGVDPKLISFIEAKKLSDSLFESKIKLVQVDENLIDLIWVDRPKRLEEPIYVHPLQYHNEPTTFKLDKIRHELEILGLDSIVVSALDEIAWIFNLRGADVPSNPVFFAYAIISLNNGTTLFVNVDQLHRDALEKLKQENIILKPYQEIYNTPNPQLFKKIKSNILKTFKKMFSAIRAPQTIKKTAIDKSCNWKLNSILTPSTNLTILTTSPQTTLKSIKNPTEQQGFRDSSLRDSRALVRCFAWLEREIASGTTIREEDVAVAVLRFREKEDLFKGVSYGTIAAAGENGSLIHYEPRGGRKIGKEMFLLDSGAHYLDGTTDVTRTMHFGQPSKFEKECYSMVLKGHIRVATMKFQKGITGGAIDLAARLDLWSIGLDYRHGTGHGVGHFNVVHEGPQLLSATSQVPLLAGMTLTDEPDGVFGIRTESLLVCREAQTKYGSGFLDFEYLTFVPFERTLIDAEVLGDKDLLWVNEYHEKCWEKLHLLLEIGSLEYKWLENAVRPIVSSSFFTEQICY